MFNATQSLAALGPSPAPAPSAPMAKTSGRLIVLIACSSTKQHFPVPARSLYRSDLFRKSLAWAHGVGANQIMVLSAKHGLVQLDEVVAPYDETLSRTSAQERFHWASRTWESLAPLIQPGDAIVLLAGRRYRDPLIPLMLEHGISKEMILAPLEGLGIGQQKRWLALATRK